MYSQLNALQVSNTPAILAAVGLLLLALLVLTALPKRSGERRSERQHRREAKQRAAELDDPYAHPMAPTGEDAPRWAETDHDDQTATETHPEADAEEPTPDEAPAHVAAHAEAAEAPALPAAPAPAAAVVEPAPQPAAEPVEPATRVRAVLFSDAILAAALAASHPLTPGDVAHTDGIVADYPAAAPWGTPTGDVQDDVQDDDAVVEPDAADETPAPAAPVEELYPPNDMPEPESAPARRGLLARLFGRRRPTEAQPVATAPSYDDDPFTGGPATELDQPTYPAFEAPVPAPEPLDAPEGDAAPGNDAFTPDLGPATELDDDSTTAPADTDPYFLDDSDLNADADVAAPAPTMGPASTDVADEEPDHLTGDNAPVAWDDGDVPATEAPKRRGLFAWLRRTPKTTSVSADDSADEAAPVMGPDTDAAADADINDDWDTSHQPTSPAAAEVQTPPPYTPAADTAPTMGPVSDTDFDDDEPVESHTEWDTLTIDDTPAHDSAAPRRGLFAWLRRTPKTTTPDANELDAAEPTMGPAGDTDFVEADYALPEPCTAPAQTPPPYTPPTADTDPTMGPASDTFEYPAPDDVTGEDEDLGDTTGGVIPAAPKRRFWTLRRQPRNAAEDGEYAPLLGPGARLTTLEHETDAVDSLEVEAPTPAAETPAEVDVPVDDLDDGHPFEPLLVPEIAPVPKMSTRAKLSSRAAARRAKRLGYTDNIDEPEATQAEIEPDVEDEAPEEEVVFVDPASWGVASDFHDDAADDDNFDPATVAGEFRLSRRAERESERAARRAERSGDKASSTEAAAPAAPKHTDVDWEALALPEPIPPREAVPARAWS